MYIKKNIELLFNELEDNVKSYLKDYDTDTLKNVFRFAYYHHQDQYRANGEEYIIHLLNTANILSGLSVDFPSILAWILHDIMRDSNVSYSKLEKKFWKEVADLVQNVTNISVLPYQEWMTTQDIDFLKRIFKIGWKDIRVLLIKISERIDFIKTLSFLLEDVQKSKARETLDIYVPLIKVFGIWKYIWNVEDICFKYLEESEYNRLENIISKHRSTYEKKIASFTSTIHKSLAEKNIEWHIEGRIKTLYSIRKKLQKKHIPLSWVYDLIALRLIVSDKVEAYTALWVIHSEFKSKKNRIKDYISAPKANGYQSIHTTVSDEDDFIFEVQIQTQQMYKYNMFWLASHIWYKWLSSNIDLYPEWMKRLFSQQKSTFSSEKFIENIRPNTLKETIICTTPKWKEIELPRKSTILDFAFKVHSDIWKKTIWSWVNNEYVDNLVYTLQDWDEIELELWQDESNYPVRYLSLLKTSLAQKSLKTIFKKQSKNKRILLWEHLLDERMTLIGYKPFDSMPRLIRRKVLKEFNIEKIKELYLELWSWNIDIDRLTNYIYNLQQDNTKYKSAVALKINFKKKEHKNIHSLFDVFHNLNIQVINFHYKWISSHINIHVPDLEILHELIAELSRAPNVSIVKRTFSYKVWWFLTGVLSISFFIVFAPAILFYFVERIQDIVIAYKVLFYISVSIYIFLIYWFKYIAKITLPWLLKQKAFWWGMILLNTFILASVIWWGYNIYDVTDWYFLFIITILLYGLTIFEYLGSKHLFENS